MHGPRRPLGTVSSAGGEPTSRASCNGTRQRVDLARDLTATTVAEISSFLAKCKQHYFGRSPNIIEFRDMNCLSPQ